MGHLRKEKLKPNYRYIVDWACKRHHFVVFAFTQVPNYAYALPKITYNSKYNNYI